MVPHPKASHRVTVDGRVMLVVCNAANRFAGVTAMHGADWRRIEEKCEELVEQAMLAERGFEVPHAAGCRVCGAEPRVHLDSDDYCLACYNELMSGYVGFNLVWGIADRTDPLPEA